MFTGLIQHLGKISEVKNRTQGKTLFITVEPERFSGFCGVKTGDSIALNGVCTTVTSLSPKGFSVDLMEESLKRTTFKDIQREIPVNLELAMSAAGRFGGHIVTGHTDSVGKVCHIETAGISKVFSIEADTKYVVEKGSITLNGVSLTVSKVENGRFEVSLIPHTLENTNFKFLKEGDFLNVEFDILAKYIEKFTSLNNNNFRNNFVTEKCSKINEKFLMENGF